MLFIGAFELRGTRSFLITTYGAFLIWFGVLRPKFESGLSRAKLLSSNVFFMSFSKTRCILFDKLYLLDNLLFIRGTFPHFVNEIEYP